MYFLIASQHNWVNYLGIGTCVPGGGTCARGSVLLNTSPAWERMDVFIPVLRKEGKKNESTFHSEPIMNFPHQIVSIYSITSLITSVFFSH